MQIAISARHGNLSNGMQQHIQQKAEKLLRFFERLTRIEVTVDFQHLEPEVELLVSAEHKHDFVARERDANVLAAVDEVVHKMEQQLRKYKQKIQDHRGRPSMGSPPPEEEDESRGRGPGAAV